MTSLLPTIEGEGPPSDNNRLCQETRSKTIEAILSDYYEDDAFSPGMIELIIQHRIEADELTEAGLAYEDVRALEHFGLATVSNTMWSAAS